MVLATPATVPQTATSVCPSVGSSTYVFKGKENNVRQHNNKKPLLICSLCKNKGHFVEACYTHQRILQNIAALTQSELSTVESHSKSGPTSSLSLWQIYRIWLIRFIFHLLVHPTLLFLRYQVLLRHGFLIMLAAII